jgi:DNA mismatch repair protein MutS
VLSSLEQGEQSGALARLADDLPLFAADVPKPPLSTSPSAVDQEFAALNPDELTPRDALNLLYRLKGLSSDG